jgi:ComF family protein
MRLAARQLWRGAVDFVFPPLGKAGTGGLDPGGWSRVTFLEAPWCDRCGAPFEYEAGPGALCPACSSTSGERRRTFTRARAACFYDEHSRDLLLQFKHADRTELGRMFALWLARAGAELLADADAVAPVPLHRGRLLGRRYNQAAEIARPLARRAGVNYLPDALRRTRPGTQGGKSAGGRRRAVQGAFTVPDGERRRVEGRRVLLVDDVLTTGATVEACARALLAAGASAVDVAVVARVRERER